MNKSQQGFAPLLIVAAILIVSGIGFVGWKISNTQDVQPSNKSAKESSVIKADPIDGSDEISEKSTKTESNEGYKVITEWGVRFPETATSNDLVYELKNDGDNQYIYFSSTSLMTAEAEVNSGTKYCAAKDGPLGAFTRSKSANPSTVVTLDGYHYGYTSPQSACSDDSKVQSMVTLVKGDLIEAIEKLELAR